MKILAGAFKTLTVRAKYGAVFVGLLDNKSPTFRVDSRARELISSCGLEKHLKHFENTVMLNVRDNIINSTRKAFSESALNSSELCRELASTQVKDIILQELVAWEYYGSYHTALAHILAYHHSGSYVQGALHRCKNSNPAESMPKKIDGSTHVDRFGNYYSYDGVWWSKQTPVGTWEHIDSFDVTKARRNGFRNLLTWELV